MLDRGLLVVLVVVVLVVLVGVLGVGVRSVANGVLVDS